MFLDLLPELQHLIRIATESDLYQMIICASVADGVIRYYGIYLPENFDYYEIICDALKIGYLMGYRKGKQRADFSK